MKQHVQLVKSGSDDLRQDAVMQQFFGLVNSFLRDSAPTRQRSLQIATFKVRQRLLCLHACMCADCCRAGLAAIPQMLLMLLHQSSLSRLCSASDTGEQLRTTV